MNSRRTSPVGAITAPAWASRNSRSMTMCFENAAPPQTRIAAEVTPMAMSPAAALVSSTRSMRRVPRPLEVINQIVDARREAVGVDLHRRELRAQRR